mgnify:CR=1 FL=1
MVKLRAGALKVELRAVRILYVTPLWSGFRDALFCGTEARGMPAFVLPLRQMIRLGYEVDLIVASPELHELDIGVEWLEESQIQITHWNIGTKIGSLESYMRLQNVIDSALTTKDYDFVYGHGSIGAIANKVALRRGVPVGVRLYGTFLARDLSCKMPNSKWKRQCLKTRCFLRHPLEYQCFTLPKEFLLVTNDGTKADYVYSQIGKKTYRWLFWLNGCSKPCQGDNEDMHSLDQAVGIFSEKRTFLLYPARIARWKRQHLAIELLAKINRCEGMQLDLVFAGHVTDEDYYKHLNKLVQTYGLSGNVHFLGPISRDELHLLYKRCLAVLSFYDVSNLGNVAIEALSNGCILIGMNDGSLDSLIVNGEAGFLVDNIDEAVAVIEGLLSNENLRRKIQFSAMNVANLKIATWDMRIKKEIQLIRQCVDGTL